jgi:hypothetical protein
MKAGFAFSMPRSLNGSSPPVDFYPAEDLLDPIPEPLADRIIGMPSSVSIEWRFDAQCRAGRSCH